MTDSKENPKVSIIIPIYNAERALERCVTSILDQEYRDFELILLDDGSKDASPSICDKFAANDDRVVVVHKQNSGVSDTRNRALDIARGEYIQFSDADDWITSDSTKLFVRAAEESNADMVIADFYRVVGDRVSRKGDIDLERVITREEYADFMLEDPADYYYGVLWNKLFKREIIEKHHLRMDPRLSWCEDFIFNMEYVLHCESIMPLHAPVYYYVKTSGSLVAQNTTVSSAVRMKLNVIDYYRDFYKRVYDSEDYLERRADVYRFLVDIPGDDGAIPGLPSTKRLGLERTSIAIGQDVEKSALTDVYFASKLLDRNFDSIAERFDLEPQDVKVFAYVKYASKAYSVKEIVDFTGYMSIRVMNSVQRLVVKHLLHIQADPDEIGASVSTILSPARADDPSSLRSAATSPRAFKLLLGSRSQALSEAVESVVSDFDDVAFNGFSDEERKQAVGYLVRAMDNIRGVL